MVLNNHLRISVARLSAYVFLIALVSMHGISICYAQTSGELSQAVDTNSVVKAIYADATHKSQYKQVFADQLEESLSSIAQSIKEVNISIIEDISNRENAPWSFSNYLQDLVTIKTMDSLTTEAVENRLNEVNYKFYSGYANVLNMDLSDGPNPITKGTPGAVDRYFYDLYMNNFCVLGSATATQQCKTNNTGDVTSFHEFFIADKSWSEAKVLDIMRIAARFFSGMDTRQAHVNDVEDRSNFLEARGVQMRANMRMAVLNNLAARRAPVSNNASLAVDILIKAYERTGQLGSSTMKDLCKTDDPSPAEAHICEMLSAPIDSDGTRLISQAVIDRIMQYDLHMSPLTYENINSPVYADGALDRYEVSLKAQLVTQAYREIELLKMKTALYAMNMLVR